MGSLLKHPVFLLGIIVPTFVGSIVISKQSTSLHTQATSTNFSVDKLTTVSQINNNHATLDTTLDTDELVQCAVPKMIPLCQSPLLLESSAPIISKEECSILIQHFDEQHQSSSAEAILQKIHHVISKVTNCPRHDGEKEPRYVRYNTKIIDEQHTKQLQLDTKRFTDNLLPDGLHVDTNNGMLFRHITAILYLTDNVDDDGNTIGGGTTFPLAIQQGNDDYNREQSEVLLTSAKTLLLNGIHHTKGDENQDINSDGRVLENAAMRVFCRDTKQIRHTAELNSQQGCRVMPIAGKLIYFHNVDDDGLSDAFSFHGGEDLLSFDTSYAAESTKSILVFFKEVPVAKFRDKGIEGFAEEVAKSRSWTRSTYNCPPYL